MHYDPPPKRDEPVAKPEPKSENETKIIVKAALTAAFATGMVAIIYFVARDQPRSFPVIAPMQSQPEPKPGPVKVSPPVLPPN